ncbi:MAG: MvaI/BcnI family restriction endonuclease [Chloroflexota bacterium]
MVELFAGVGGFRLGLEPHGFETVWANQWEPASKAQHAWDAYALHFGDFPHGNANIESVIDLAEKGVIEIPDHEVLVGGFPCQDYSVAKTLNQALGLEGKKGVLWWQIHRILTMKRPPYFFLENVDRLLKSPASQRGRDFAVMLATLGNLGYEVEWRMINAADYGFPQKRRRVYIVGRRAGPNPRIPAEVLRAGTIGRAFPIHETSALDHVAPFPLIGDAADISEDFNLGGGESPFRSAGYFSHRLVWSLDLKPDNEQPAATLGDILEPERAVPESFFVRPEQLEQWKYLKGAKDEARIHKGSGAPYRYQEGSLPFPDRTDGPARTILTAEGGSTPSRFKHIILTPSGRYRRLTPRELERLNGFPDDWTATGMPEGRRAFMMGNALVVGVVERIARELASDIGNADNPECHPISELESQSTALPELTSRPPIIVSARQRVDHERHRFQPSPRLTITGELLTREDALRKLSAVEDLRALAEEVGVSPWIGGNFDRGWPGKTIEKFLGLVPNSRQDTDFDGWELKVVSVRDRRQGVLAKESMKITGCRPSDFVSMDLESSHLLRKLDSMVVVGRWYLGPNEVSAPLFRALAFDLDRDDLYEQVSKDYEAIRALVVETKTFANLHSSVGELVQVRASGAGHGTKTRSFYARALFVDLILGIETQRQSPRARRVFDSLRQSSGA